MSGAHTEIVPGTSPSGKKVPETKHFGNVGAREIIKEYFACFGQAFYTVL